MGGGMQNRHIGLMIYLSGSRLFNTKYPMSESVHHFSAPAGGIACASSPKISSTLLSSVIPQIIHGSSTPLNILLCSTRCSTIFFCCSSPVPFITVSNFPPTPFLIFSRLCIDFILTTTCNIAESLIGIIPTLVLTMRGSPIYLCNIQFKRSFGWRELMRVRKEANMPSRQIALRVATSPLFWQECWDQSAFVYESGVVGSPYSANAVYSCLCFACAVGAILRRWSLGQGRLLSPFTKNL